MNTNNKILYNTLILYGKVIVSVFVVFLSTRIVLDTLGEADYGLLNVITGTIAAFSFLNGALTASTQRYLSYHKGSGDELMSKSIFFHSCFLHLVMALLIMVFLFFIETYVLTSLLNIQYDRIDAARFLYRSMMLASFFTIMTVPFNAVLSANENMIAFSFFSVTIQILTLILAFVMSYYHGDRLMFYGVGLTIINLFIYLFQLVYCSRRYSECKYSKEFRLKKNILKELISYIGWNSFGSFTGMAKNEGGAVLLNMFYGTRINASYGIANKLANQMNYFSAMLLKSMEPQLMKSEGAGNRDRMIKLSYMSSKVGYYLIAIFAIPTIFEIESILSIWLKDVPSQAPFFCRMILCAIMINRMTIGLQSGLQSLGKIKYYMLLGGGLRSLMLPVSYVFLKMGYDFSVVMYCYIFFEIVYGIIRVYYFCYYTKVPFSSLLRNIFLCQLWPTIIVFISGLIIFNFHISYGFLLSYPVLFIIFLASVYFFGLKEEEKSFCTLFANKIFSYVPIIRRV